MGTHTTGGNGSRHTKKKGTEREREPLLRPNRLGGRQRTNCTLDRRSSASSTQGPDPTTQPAHPADRSAQTFRSATVARTRNEPLRLRRPAPSVDQQVHFVPPAVEQIDSGHRLHYRPFDDEFKRSERSTAHSCDRNGRQFYVDAATGSAEN
jgi:hypothetical protein